MPTLTARPSLVFREGLLCRGLAVPFCSYRLRVETMYPTTAATTP